LALNRFWRRRLSTSTRRWPWIRNQDQAYGPDRADAGRRVAVLQRPQQNDDREDCDMHDD